MNKKFVYQVGNNKKVVLFILFVLFHDYYISHMLTCMDASLKNVYTVSFMYTAYHLWSKNKQLSLYVKISNLHRSDSSTLKYSYCSKLANYLTLFLLTWRIW